MTRRKCSKEKFKKHYFWQKMSQFIPFTRTSRTLTEDKEKEIGSNNLISKLMRIGTLKNNPELLYLKEVKDLEKVLENYSNNKSNI